MHMQEKPDKQEGVKIGHVMMSPDNGMDNQMEL